MPSGGRVRYAPASFGGVPPTLAALDEVTLHLRLFGYVMTIQFLKIQHSLRTLRNPLRPLRLNPLF